MRRPHCATGRAGFTLIELLVILAVLGVAILVGFPALDKMMHRSKLEVSARQAGSLMQAARFEAIRRGQRAGVTQDFAAREVIAFADLDSTDTLTAADRILNRFTLPAGIDFYGPLDGGGDHTNASWNFAENVQQEGTALFSSDGSSVVPGAFRFTDYGGNFLETRVDPPATARIAVQKYDPVNGDPNDPQNWDEPGEGGEAWKWN